jgi:hypothetical protein
MICKFRKVEPSLSSIKEKSLESRRVRTQPCTWIGATDAVWFNASLTEVGDSMAGRWTKRRAHSSTGDAASKRLPAAAIANQKMEGDRAACHAIAVRRRVSRASFNTGLQAGLCLAPKARYSISAWGNAPGICVIRNPSAESAIHSNAPDSRLQRFLRTRSKALGRCPRLSMRRAVGANCYECGMHTGLKAGVNEKRLTLTALNAVWLGI